MSCWPNWPGADFLAISSRHLEASEAAWSTGSGPEVKGPAASLILAMAGGRAGTDDLTGPGADQLRALTS